MLKRVKRIINQRILIPLIYHTFWIFPVKRNKVVFDNFCGKGYGCNPKYIAGALLKRNEKLDMVWLVENMDEEMPEGIRKVKYKSLRSAYELATAKVWVDNVRSSFRIRKKKSQFYIQTWHCGIGLKKSEKEVESTLSKEYVRCAKRDGKITDLMISNGSYRTKRYYDNFWYDGEVLESGFPRCDLLVNSNDTIRKKVYASLGIEEDCKLILYAPSFRRKKGKSDNELDVYCFDYEKCRKVLESKFGGKYIFLLRLHPNIKNNSKYFQYTDTVKDATNYSDIQELLAFSDVLITDYSSCMFDSMYAKNKVFLFAKDSTSEESHGNNYLFSFDELPCSLAENEEELFQQILDYSHEDYERKCNDFFGKIHMTEPGNASDTVADIIVERCVKRSNE